MNITYIRQRPFFKKVKKTRTKLKLTHHTELQQSKLSTLPSQQLTLHEKLFSQELSRLESANISSISNNNITRQHPNEKYSFDNFLKRRQSQKQQHLFEPSYAYNKVYRNQHKSGYCRNPNFTHRSEKQRQSNSINSYNTRPTIAPTTKDKLKYHHQIEKKLTLLEKKIRQQFDRSQETFDNLEQLQKQMQKQKQEKYEQFKKQAQLIHKRIQKQKRRNQERQKSKNILINQFLNLLSTNQMKIPILQKLITSQLSQRHQNSNSPTYKHTCKSIKSASNTNSQPIKHKLQTIYSNNQNWIDHKMTPHKMVSQQQVGNRALKDISNKQAYIKINKSDKDSESILLDDSIFG